MIKQYYFIHYVIINNFCHIFHRKDPTMKTLSTALLADLITTNRKKLSMTQQSLADATGINRSLISRMEKEDFLPSIPQLEQLGEVLGFEPINVFTDGTQMEHRRKKETSLSQ